MVGDIPLEPPGFQPRAGLLARLDHADARVSVIHTTNGLRGRGTTQLAAAYARAKLAAGWRLVAWVNAADIGSMQAGLAAVAEATGLTGGGSGPGGTDVGQAVRHLLETDGDRCLLVFDDVADPEAVSPFVPAGGRARVLIASTRHAPQSLRAAVPADVFTTEEALAFLAARTGLDDEPRAAEVAVVLGYLPLALALAAPVIRGQRHGYARYLDRLQMTSASASLTGDDGQRYPHNVERAVLLALSAIRTADETGMCARVMAIMAVLSAAGIRRELLHVAGRTGFLAGGGRRVAADLVDQALEWLSDRSLLTFSLDGQTVIMHRLIAQVIRDGLVRGRRLGAVCWVAASVLEAHAIEAAGPRGRPAVRRIPQHVAALQEHAATLAGEGDDELAEILLRLRFISLHHLIELGDSASQAIATGELLTADLDRLLGPGHLDTLNARNNLAAAYLAADRVADAIPLFEQTLATLVRQLGPGDPDTLTLQNNLASAYQDAGRGAEAIQLYEQNLAERERLLGADHIGTLTSRGNLAAAYLAAGRAAEAIPLLEQTLTGRERALGPDHPDTQTSRRNLAKAYQDGGRAADAIPLLEQTPVSQPRVLRLYHPRIQPAQSEAPADAAEKARPASFRRPPAESARPALPVGFRRPPADPARPARPDRGSGPPARLPGYTSPGRAQDASLKDAGHDRDVVEATAARDPAGIAMAYDRYAAGLYGYIHWMLHDQAATAESLQDTFVLATAALGGLPEPVKLRPWLFALARTVSRHRVRPRPTTRGEGDAADKQAGEDRRGHADGNQLADEPGSQAAPADQSAEATMQFDVVGGEADTTMRFSAVREPVGAVGDEADTTMRFSAVREPVGAVGDEADTTMRFSAVREPVGVVRDVADATMQFSMVGQLADATMQFRAISGPVGGTDGIADFGDYLGQAEMRDLIRSILAGMRPREREVVELSIRHDLDDNDLAIVLGLPFSRAHALAARTRGRLEKSLGALRTALAGQQACPVMGELLADWDGQLTEQTHDLVVWHMEQCQTCVNQARGALHPKVLPGLLPLPPLPPELRKKILGLCSSDSEDAVAYRRQVARRAEKTRAAAFSRAISHVSWDGIRANPGVAIAATAVLMWVVAAVSVTLLTFASPSAAHAQANPSAGLPAAHARATQASTGVTRSPAAAPTTATARPSVTARPSPVVTQPSTYVPPRVQPSPSPSPSKSPGPSKSPSPKSSSSPSPSSSPSSSPSPSKSPSPTA